MSRLQLANMSWRVALAEVIRCELIEYGAEKLAEKFKATPKFESAMPGWSLRNLGQIHFTRWHLLAGNLLDTKKELLVKDQNKWLQQNVLKINFTQQKYF